MKKLNLFNFAIILMALTLFFGAPAFAGPSGGIVDVEQDQFQVQSTVNFVIPFAGISGYEGVQGQEAGGWAIGGASGSTAQNEIQGQSYNNISGFMTPFGGALTQHYGETVMTAEMAGGVDAPGGIYGAEGHQGFETITGTFNLGPSIAMSGSEQEVYQGINGGALGNTGVQQSMYIYSVTGYINGAMTPTSMFVHEGGSYVNASVRGGAAFAGAYGAETHGDQAGITVTMQTPDATLQVAGQEARADGYADAGSVGFAGAGASLEMGQYHSYNQATVNPATGAFQSQSGTVTTNISVHD